MTPKIRIRGIEHESYVDGPGKRAVVFLQGCSIRCPGCQSIHLWPQDGGQAMEVSEVAEELVGTGLPITVSGGEPFDQAGPLALLLLEIRSHARDRHVIVYTGYRFEELLRRGGAAIDALGLTDVLVDGPYIRELDSPHMQYRGSTNQRPIDVQATVGLVPYMALTMPAVLDWDTPEVIIDAEGDLLAPTPLALQFAGLGRISPTRRCGEVTR